MKLGAAATLLCLALAACGGDGSPISGDYCVQADAAKCATVSFPAKRGADTIGTIQLEGRRYEVRWMETENGRRQYIANLPGNPIAFDIAAVDTRTVIVRWRDKRPEQTYTLK